MKIERDLNDPKDLNDLKDPIMNTIDEQLKQLSQQSYPKQVDVVDSVMAEVRKHPYLQPVAQPAVRKTRWVPWASISAAAAAVGLVVLNITPASAATFNEEQISSMMAYVSDCDNYYTPVESSAENPIEYLYDEYDEEL